MNRFSWEKLDEFLNIDELKADELMVMTAQEAMLRMQKNANMLAQVNNLLLEATSELGKWRVVVEKLKHTKSTLIEQNRALKEILKAERW